MRVSQLFRTAILSALGFSLLASQIAAAEVAYVQVTFDRQGILSSTTRGHADLAAHRAVTVDDPVRIASVSKLVVAIAVMRLVEQGRLKLDADVSSTLGYPLRNPHHPTVPITLRLLLSHRSSITDDAGYVIPYDAELRDKLSEPAAWDAAHAPGDYFRYANLNLPIVAAVMEQATGERFDRLMRRLVLEPLRLDACFNWQGCSDAARSRAVVLYEDGKPVVDDLRGRAPDCPVVRGRDGGCELERWQRGRNGAMFSPQGGLRISARDLATIGRMLLGDGRVDGIRLLSRSSIRTLKTPLWHYDGRNGITAEEDAPSERGMFCRYGLAMQFLTTHARGCADDPVGDGHERYGHAGSAYGLLSGLWIDATTATGVAFFVTDAEPTPGRRSAFRAIEERAIAHEHSP